MFPFEKRPPSAVWVSNAEGDENLGLRTAKGAVLLSVGQGAQMAVRLAGTFILSRLLAPGDFGLVAMAATVTLFAGLFTDLGLSTATIRAEKISQRMVSTLFVVNLGLGLALAGLCIALAPWLATFFDDPRVSGLILVLSVTLPLNAAAAQHTALLTRFMCWREIQFNMIFTQVVALGLAIWAVLYGAGYWAIAIQLVATAVLTVTLAWFFCSWRPSRDINFRSVIPDLKFGSNIAAFGFVNWFHRQGDKTLIGRQWGPEVLGYYARAYTLYMIPISLLNGPLRTVCLPMLSKTNNDPEAWKAGALDVLMISTGVGALFSVVFSASTEPIVTVVLGPNWEPSIELFRILSLSYLVASPMTLMGILLVSRGKSGRMLLSGVINCSTLFIAFIIGLPWGAVGVAAAYTITMTALFLPTLWLVLLGSPLSFGTAIRHILPLQVVGACAFALSGLLPLDGISIALFRLAAAGLASFLIFIAIGALVIRIDPAQARMRQHIGFVIEHLRSRSQILWQKFG